MASYRLAKRSVKGIGSLETCLACQLRQWIPVFHESNTTRIFTTSNGHAKTIKSSSQIRSYAAQKLDVQRLRKDVDARARLGFYELSKQQGAFSKKMEKGIADSIYKDFLAQKSTMDHGKNVLRLAKKYNVEVEDITSLAIATFKIPDLSDPVKRAKLPPSQHKSSAGMILQGCAQAEDPLAIIHILTAVYLTSVNPNTGAKELARLFPQSEIAKYRATLDAITLRAKEIALGPDALTLKGLFLEQEDQRQRAKELYQEGILRSHIKYTPGSRHPMLLPLMTPWNALGYLLKSDQDPLVQAEAKQHFELGALKGDDPLSYYELAAFEPKTSTKWLQYTSKAAASGHRQAIINITKFYQELSAKDSPILKDSSIRKTLHWLLNWRRGSAAALAREWLQVASNIGHKPSMLELADYHDSTGDNKRAKEYLRQILEPPITANESEEWPQLVQLARRRLAGIR